MSQPKAQGLLHMECEFNRTPYKRSLDKLLGGISTSQPQCSQESTRKTPLRWSSEELEDALRSIWMLAVLDYEELGACQTWAHGTMHIAYIF
jgi:hypothetical protein